MAYGHIISFGYDTSLMSSRSLVLESAGFTVEEAYSSAGLLRLARNDLVDLVVICHTVPTKEQERLIDALREIRELPIICVAASQWEAQKRGVTVENSPVPLVDAVRFMIRAGNS